MVRYSDKKHNKDSLRYLCRTNEINMNESKSFLVENRSGVKLEIAVFNFAGKYYTISNRCTHEGGPVSKGKLRKKIVT
jgi:nitrite reductase/ring-hydroxylating ferredoxin subunit